MASFHKARSIAENPYEESASGQFGIQNMALFAGLISLEPQDRAWLHQRIAQRFEAMLAAGLLEEVRALRTRGDLHPDLPAMRCVGYRQAWSCLKGEFPLSELRDKGIFCHPPAGQTSDHLAAQYAPAPRGGL
jgi:tRNA A37 N6-isopentenylltransferase MiaA